LHNFDNIDSTTIKSPLKWAGGKYRLLDTIFQLFPATANAFYEPFFGGGSVGLNAMKRLNANTCFVGDTNSCLVQFWNALKEQPENFIAMAASLFVAENNTDEAYRLLRREFNRTTDIFRKSVLFLYLNRHCFNGLCRLNTHGEFNVPFGKYEKPLLPINELKAASRRLFRFTVSDVDFRDLFAQVGQGNAVYCDPPYLPLSNTANFTGYGIKDFTFTDQEDLVKCAVDAASKGATVIISNQYTVIARELYKNASYRKVIKVPRLLSRDGDTRMPVEEILAVYYPYNEMPAEKRITTSAPHLEDDAFFNIA